MCTFITLWVTPAKAWPAVQDVVRSHDESFRLVDAGSWERLFGRPGCLAIHAIHCDCGTAVGSGEVFDPRGETHAKQVAKKKKLGWSDSRIQKWLASREAALSAAYSTQRGNWEGELTDWVILLKVIAEAKGVNSVGLVHHFYNGPVHQDSPARLDARTVDVEALNSDHLAQLPADTVLFVERRP